LTDEFSMEYGDASGTALMDVRKRKWSEELVEAIDPRLMDKLPPLHSSAEPSGHLKKEVAESLGLAEGIIVSAGGGDNMMGAIGTGNTRPGIVTASLGTSGTIYAYSETSVIDPIGEVAAFCDSTNGWLPLVCTMNVTVATELIRSLFGYSHEELARAVVNTPPGSGGPVLLPYYNGERTPDLPKGTGGYTMGSQSRPSRLVIWPGQRWRGLLWGSTMVSTGSRLWGSSQWSSGSQVEERGTSLGGR